MERLRVGIIGAGHIARKMGYTLREMEDAEPYAVASRNLENAQGFADEWGFAKAYWDYLKEQLAIAEKYRIYPMLNVFMTPDWASSAPKDPEMLRSGCRKRNRCLSPKRCGRATCLFQRPSARLSTAACWGG